MTEPALDVQVRDQDEQLLSVTDTYTGHGALVVHVTVDRPPPKLPLNDTIVAFAAALLGMNLQRDVRHIAADIEKELTRMGYELRSVR